MLVSLLHLCDSLFPVGAFAYSDGLETATRRGAVADSAELGEWLDTCLDETIGRLEGPAAWQAWSAFVGESWDDLITLDAELTSLRPSASSRRSSRAMGLRLLTTWQHLHPDRRLEEALALAERRAFGPSFPIAFACACARAGVDRRQTVESLAYTRLAATVSAAMRLMSIGQTDAHWRLTRTLGRVPDVVDAIRSRNGNIESFTPALDIALMTQQYLPSRLFRS
ncbi:MAG TPA: urease accessory UreF family protein [Vicinamibacterales bacterium]|jgi:urease accessory protein|nr:urease accessory UreF family protein [Vicinamibacterales bacterium]